MATDALLHQTFAELVAGFRASEGGVDVFADHPIRSEFEAYGQLTIDLQAVARSVERCDLNFHDDRVKLMTALLTLAVDCARSAEALGLVACSEPTHA